MLTREDNELITRTGPGTPMGALWRRFWNPVLLAGELPAPDCPPVRVRVLGEDLVAFRDSAGQVGLLAANCPHRGASLFFGRNEEDGLRCVYHGWKFDTAGHCTDMPNEPPESDPSAPEGLRTGFKHKVRQTAYPCREAGGMVWAYMGPNQDPPDVPEMDFNLVSDGSRYVSKMWVESNYLQALEGDIDNSHASFLHGRLGGSPDQPFMDRLRASGGASTGTLTRQFGQYFVKDTAPRALIQQTDFGIMMGWRREADETHHQWRINLWMLPGFALIANGVPGSTIGCNIRVPLDDENSWFFRVRWNPERPLSDQEQEAFRHAGFIYPELIPGTFMTKANQGNDYLIDRELQKTAIVSGIKSVTQQDRAMTDSMGPIYDRTKEHLGTSDGVIIAMRRRMLQLVRSLADRGDEPYAAAHPEVYRLRPIDILLDRDVPWVERCLPLMAPLA